MLATLRLAPSCGGPCRVRTGNVPVGFRGLIGDRVSQEDAERRLALQTLMGSFRRSADPQVVAEILRVTPNSPDPEYLPTGRFSQGDMGYALGVGEQSYRKYELGWTPPPREVLLSFGHLCSVHDPLTLNNLWQLARFQGYPRRSDLFGLNLPAHLVDLAWEDTPDEAAAARAAMIAGLHKAALRAIHHVLRGQANADINPHTPYVQDIRLATGFTRDAAHDDTGIFRSDLQPAERAWCVWELRRLGVPTAARIVRAKD